MLAGRWVLFGCLSCALARAEAPSISIWYRSSERCPTGSLFIERLATLGREANLAGAGDAIDFVVTLGSEGDKSVGRLERQTERGTVAIREVEAPDCSEVAEALALSLDLALEPRGNAARDAEPAPEPQAATDSREPLPATTKREPAMAAQRETKPTADVADIQTPASATEPRQHRTFALGAQALLTTGVGPTPLFGGGVFGELSPASWPLSTRATALAAFGSSTVEGATLDFRVLWLRLEGCPLALHFGGATWSPCAAGEFGVLSAQYQSSSGVSDNGPWAAAALHVRAAWHSQQQDSLEVQAGAQMPLIRYETRGNGENSDPLASTAAIGFTAAFGGAFSLL